MTANYMTSNDGGVTSRPMTETEIEIYLLAISDTEIEKNKQTKIQADKLAARQAVLDKLGLTADEAAALLG